MRLASSLPIHSSRLYEFEPQGDSLLAGLVVWDDGEFESFDYPARRDPYSAWRVDDEGELCPECFTVLFVLRAESGCWVGLSWAGAEGESLQLLCPAGGGQLRQVVSGYRYLAPQ